MMGRGWGRTDVERMECRYTRWWMGCMPRCCVGIRGGRKGAMHSVNTADPRRAFSSPLGRRRRAHTARKKEGKEKIYGALLVPLLRGERALERCIYHLEIRIGKGEGESTLLLLLSCSARYAFHLASLAPSPPLAAIFPPSATAPIAIDICAFPSPFPGCANKWPFPHRRFSSPGAPCFCWGDS